MKNKDILNSCDESAEVRFIGNTVEVRAQLKVSAATAGYFAVRLTPALSEPDTTLVGSRSTPKTSFRANLLQ